MSVVAFATIAPAGERVDRAPLQRVAAPADPAAANEAREARLAEVRADAKIRAELRRRQMRSVLPLGGNAKLEYRMKAADGRTVWLRNIINTVSLDAYTADVLKGEQPLRDVLAAHGQSLKYYRHPYLHVGASPEAKKGLASFLADRGYTVAPVTLDNADYAFAAAYVKVETRSRVRREYVPYIESTVEFFESRSVEVVGREFPQILLIHANQLNADLIPELLAMFERRGYRFVTLDEALSDPAYRQAESYTGKGGFSWIHRWSREKGLPNKGEPEAPAWVIKAFEARR